jgi:hypothetical protein
VYVKVSVKVPPGVVGGQVIRVSLPSPPTASSNLSAAGGLGSSFDEAALDAELDAEVFKTHICIFSVDIYIIFLCICCCLLFVVDFFLCQHTPCGIYFFFFLLYWSSYFHMMVCDAVFIDVKAPGCRRFEANARRSLENEISVTVIIIK